MAINLMFGVTYFVAWLFVLAVSEQLTNLYSDYMNYPYSQKRLEKIVKKTNKRLDKLEKSIDSIWQGKWKHEL